MAVFSGLIWIVNFTVVVSVAGHLWFLRLLLYGAGGLGGWDCAVRHLSASGFKIIAGAIVSFFFVAACLAAFTDPSKALNLFEADLQGGASW